MHVYAAVRPVRAHICGHQLFSVVNAGHGYLPVTYHGVVVWVGGNEKHFCSEKETIIVNVVVYCTLQLNGASTVPPFVLPGHSVEYV